MPLFYRKPELLSAAQHGNLRIRPGDHSFARDTNAVPLAIIEFGAAMRDYPIVFSAGDNYPVAVLGLDHANSFITGDEWEKAAYIPAYIRRYPFVFADCTQDSFILAIDRAADNVVAEGEQGEPLFQNGEPAELVKNVMAFCRDFHDAHAQTGAFVGALAKRGLLVENQADAKLPSGRAMKLSGFKVVDRQKFEALPDDIVLAWHRKGWLALIHFHLLSLDRFADLLAREDRLATDNASKRPDPETSDSMPVKETA
ncbi:SapC family protein [Erythrobacter aureus]|uniref:SapC family protein n=1 Tax=Erythrobacter aureus TaxID=2182384 RepID=UPI003A8F2357